MPMKLYKVLTIERMLFSKKINDYKNLQRGLGMERLVATFNEQRSGLNDKILRLRHSFDDDALANARREYMNMKNQCENWDKELENIKALKAQFAEKYERLKANPPDKTELDEKEGNWNQLRSQLQREEAANNEAYQNLLYKKRHNEGCQASIEQTLRRKMETLANWHKNETYLRAWDFYTKNKDQFRHPVYVPFLFVSTDNKYTKYLNNLIGNKDMGIFIFGCNEDEKLLQSKFKISSSVMTPQMTAQNTHHVELDAEMKRMGFIDYACNIFTAPEPVKAYFNSVNYFHKTPIGDESTDRNCETIAHKINGTVQLFLSNKSRVNIITSRYAHGKITVNRTPLKADGLIGGMHTSKIRNIKENTDEIDNKLREVADRRTTLEGRGIEISRMKGAIAELRRKYQIEIDQLKIAEQNFQKAERQEKSHGTSKPNLEQAKKVLKEMEKTAKEQIPKEVANIVKAFGAYQKEANSHGLKTVQSRRYQALIDLTREEIDEIDLQAQESVQRYQEFKAEEERLRTIFLNARRELKDLVGISTTNPENLTRDEHKKIYEDLLKKFEEYKVPETIEEIDNEIQQEEIRAQVGNLRGSKEDVKKLARLEQEEQDVNTLVERSDNVIQNWETDMKTLLDQWLTPLKELIAKISENFVNFFGKIGCAGEVRLVVPETNPLNINEYGIDIYVKFRSYNQLRRLTAQQQSGGERSVSTMLYLMALQELCPVPFRCVDEINQGMDPTNERLVFNMMVELLSGNTGHLAHTQYFMLTPKLLPGLKYTPKVSVLMINNSPMMDRGTDILNVKDKPYELKVGT
jgi:chromosome segregation ATPase